MGDRAQAQIEGGGKTDRLTTVQAAEYLSVSVPTLRRWTKAGLPAIRKGKRWIRYQRTDLDRWLVDHRVGESVSQPEPSRTPSSGGIPRRAELLSEEQANEILSGLRRGPRKSIPKKSEDSASRAGGAHA